MDRKEKRLVRWKMALLLAGALLALAPVTGLAQTTGVAQGVLYEVLEAPPDEFTPSGARIMPGAILPIGDRLAQATEAGTLAGSGTLDFLTGSVTVRAQSRVPFDPATGFGVGTVSGGFKVTNGSSTVIGKLDGQLDMSPLTSTIGGCPCPLATISGMWSTLGSTKTSGMFSGVFLVPTDKVLNGTWVYVNPTSGQIQIEPLQPHEFGKDGSPLIKLLVTLYQ